MEIFKMKMRKQIQKDGDSAMIRITLKELEIYNWKIGDVLDFSDIVLVKKEGRK